MIRTKLIIPVAVSLALALFSPAGARANGSSLRVVKYDIPNGLVSGEVNAIMQDSRGFMWAGTSNGLSRFDGYEFMHFRSDYKRSDFFASNIILDICEDEDGRLWLATAKGGCLFDPRDQSVMKIPIPADGNQRVGVIRVIDRNTVLLGAVQGLFVYDIPTGKCEKFAAKRYGDRPVSGVRDIYKDEDGYIWIGMWGKGLMKIDLQRRQILSTDYLELPDDLNVTRILKDSLGRMYIATWGEGLICIQENGSGEVTRTMHFRHPVSDPHHLDHNIIYDLAIDRGGVVWMGTPSGLKTVECTAEGFREVPPPDGLRQLQLHEVRSIAVDQADNIWLSDFGNGMVMLQKNDAAIKETDIRSKGLNFGIVTGIYELSDSELWLGVMGYGLVRYDRGAGKIIGDDSGYLDRINRESNSIVDFEPIPQDNTVYMAARYYGVYQARVEDGAITGLRHFDLADEPRRNGFTTCLEKDSDNNIWVGTRNGIVILKYDAQAHTHKKTEPHAINSLLGKTNIECLTRDGNGRIWVGSTESGLYRLSYDMDADSILSLSHYDVESGKINNNNIQCVYQDAAGMLWAGTYGGGISRYDEGNDIFTVAGNMHLFSSDIISSITSDARGNLWLATGQGIVCYDPREQSVRNYGTGNGYANISFIKGAALNTGEEIFFGGYDGLSEFRPGELLGRGPQATPSIVDIQLLNESINRLDSAKRVCVADNMPPYTRKLTLTYKDRSVGIRFAAPGGDNSPMIKYAYMLEGIDKQWNNANSLQRTVTYTNLALGEYVFMVMASNYRGEWNQTPASIEITVLPPPWRTWWAYLLYLLFAAAIAMMAIRIVRNRIRLREALKIEQIERIKSEEVNDAKFTFFTNVSHELFTPITIISTSLEKIFENQDGGNPLLSIIKSNLNRLMRLLQQVMEFRKAESANLRLRVSQMDIVAFVKRICDENFAPLVGNKNIHIIFTSDADSIVGFADPDKLDKIVYNLLSNAFKYNRQDGRVFVDVSHSDKGEGRLVTVRVSDTGYGIEPEKLPLLFKRFYEGDYRKFNTKGTGIGLSLTRDLATLHNGVIDVESTVGQGTTFTVTIPIDRGAYAEEQIDRIDMPVSGLLPATAAIAREHDETRDTLLIVEDNEELLLVMHDILSAHYNVLTARNGHEAIEVLSAKDVNMVITDYVMPGMDGIELTAYIRNNVELSHLPIIMLSARSAVDSRMDSYRAGVDSYVSKPFEVNLLVAQVDSIIANRRKMAERFRSDKEIATEGIINTALDKQFLDRVVELIEQNISEQEFDINALHSAMNMSNSTLYRKIKSLTGMPPKEFVRNIRFKVACKLLLEQTSNISDVAFMVGFADAKYFSLCFKKEFGITPRAYINQNKGK